MSSTPDLDPIFRNAIKLLHSPATDSAEKIRIALDEIIERRHGASKTLANTLQKKYLAEECMAPGSGSVQRKPPVRMPSNDSTKSSNLQFDAIGGNSSPAAGRVTDLTIAGSNSDVDEMAPLVISVPDDDSSDNIITEEDQLKELEDLTCLVCRTMNVSARNRLIECADCSSLYHQECHKPPISESDANEQEYSWCCTLCKNKTIKPIPAVASPAKSSSSHSSSSSSSSGHFRHKSSGSGGSSSKAYESYTVNVSKTSSSKTGGQLTKTTTSTKTTGSFSNFSNVGGAVASSSKPPVTPNINIISADKRLQIMKKKAAKLQETKRKHK